MSENVSESVPFKWDKRKEQAAALLAAGELTTDAIAARMKINPRTLFRWQEDAPFKARIEEHRAAWRAEIKAQGISNKQNRVDAINRRWGLLEQIRAERAAEHQHILDTYDPDATDSDGKKLHMEPPIPGATTGFIVRQYKVIGGGENARMVVEHAVDVGLLREFRAHEEQAAKELGQMVDKKQHDVRHIMDRELARVAEEMGVDEKDLRAEFNSLIGNE